MANFDTLADQIFPADSYDPEDETLAPYVLSLLYDNHFYDSEFEPISKSPRFAEDDLSEYIVDQTGLGPYERHILGAIFHCRGRLIQINGYAGCGKTSTIKYVFDYYHMNRRRAEPGPDWGQRFAAFSGIGETLKPYLYLDFNPMADYLDALRFENHSNPNLSRFFKKRFATSLRLRTWYMIKEAAREKHNTGADDVFMEMIEILRDLNNGEKFRPIAGIFPVIDAIEELETTIKESFKKKTRFEAREHVWLGAGKLPAEVQVELWGAVLDLLHREIRRYNGFLSVVFDNIDPLHGFIQLQLVKMVHGSFPGLDFKVIVPSRMAARRLTEYTLGYHYYPHNGPTPLSAVAHALVTFLENPDAYDSYKRALSEEFKYRARCRALDIGSLNAANDVRGKLATRVRDCVMGVLRNVLTEADLSANEDLAAAVGQILEKESTGRQFRTDICAATRFVLTYIPESVDAEMVRCIVRDYANAVGDEIRKNTPADMPGQRALAVLTKGITDSILQANKEEDIKGTIHNVVDADEFMSSAPCNNILDINQPGTLEDAFLRSDLVVDVFHDENGVPTTIMLRILYKLYYSDRHAYSNRAMIRILKEMGFTPGQILFAVNNLVDRSKGLIWIDRAFGYPDFDFLYEDNWDMQLTDAGLSVVRRLLKNPAYLMAHATRRRTFGAREAQRKPVADKFVFMYELVRELYDEEREKILDRGERLGKEAAASDITVEGSSPLVVTLEVTAGCAEQLFEKARRIFKKKAVNPAMNWDALKSIRGVHIRILELLDSMIAFMYKLSCKKDNRAFVEFRKQSFYDDVRFFRNKLLPDLPQKCGADDFLANYAGARDALKNILESKSLFVNGMTSDEFIK